MALECLSAARMFGAGFSFFLLNTRRRGCVRQALLLIRVGPYALRDGHSHAVCDNRLRVEETFSIGSFHFRATRLCSKPVRSPAEKTVELPGGSERECAMRRACR